MNTISNKAGETFWMLLSLLSLPTEKQISILGGLPDQDDPLAKDYSNNNAAFLLDMLVQYYSGWLDEFYPDCPAAIKLYELVDGDESFPLSREGFVDGDSWIKLRNLAVLSLEESGLPLYPVPDQIDFDRYIEIIK